MGDVTVDILTVNVNSKVPPVALPDDVGSNAGVEASVVPADGVHPELRALGYFLQSGRPPALQVDVFVPTNAGLRVGLHLTVQDQSVPPLYQWSRGWGGRDYRDVGNNYEDRLRGEEGDCGPHLQ